MPLNRSQRVLFGSTGLSALVAVGLGAVFRPGRLGQPAPRPRQTQRAPGDRPTRPEQVAEAFVNAWSTFRYEEALEFATGETGSRVELALQKEATLDSDEKEMADRLRGMVKGLQIHLDVVEFTQRSPTEIFLRARAVATDGTNELTRNQTFRMKLDHGWRVAEWDPGERRGSAGAAPAPSAPTG